MSESEAHDEVNMLHAKIEKSVGEPTAEEYEEALGEIEELKRIAEEEPASLKILNSIGRMVNRSSRATQITLLVIGEFLVTASPSAELGASVPTTIQATKERKDRELAFFQSASSTLRELKRKAEQM